MWTAKMGIVLPGALALALAACGTPPGTPATVPIATTGTTTPTTSSASGTGTVQAIDLVSREQAGLGMGALAGAAVGGVLGSQVGSGSGKTAATVAGVAGGALVGHEMEKRARSADRVYRVTVRMDDGSLQTLVQETLPQVQIGERVRLANGVIVERYR